MLGLISPCSLHTGGLPRCSCVVIMDFRIEMEAMSISCGKAVSVFSLPSSFVPNSLVFRIYYLSFSWFHRLVISMFMGVLVGVRASVCL